MASSKEEDSTRKTESRNSIGRRGFLKSLLGLGAGVAEGETESAQKAEAKATGGACLLWGDLHTGFVGFPSGLNLRQGPAGSVMKLIAAAAIMEKGLLDPNHRVDCKGHAEINGETFHCQFPHGFVDLTNAIAVSCNVYFVHASEKISTGTFLALAKVLGLHDAAVGRPSGPFPEQTHDPSYTFILGLNQAMQPTALQLLRLAALIAAKGEPPYLHSADDLEPGAPFHAKLAESTWHRLQQGMEFAARDGTAKHLDPENKLHIAAKTGTSIHGKKFQSCIIGFFPYEKPRHVFCIWSPTGTSQESAVPEAKKFLFSTTWPT